MNRQFKRVYHFFDTYVVIFLKRILKPLDRFLETNVGIILILFLLALTLGANWYEVVHK